jgi:dephospho-CoA kinase
MTLPDPPEDMLMIIIGFVGLMGSGKSSGTEYLLRKHGFYEIAFADAMRAAMGVLHIPRTRETMQRFGTDLFRNQWDKDIWVHNIECRISNHIREAKDRGDVYGNILGYAIPDARFSNEVAWIKEHGGYLIGLEADPECLLKRAMKRSDKVPPESREKFFEQLRHGSEKHIPSLLDECDYMLDGNLNLQEFLYNVEQTFRAILKKEIVRRFEQEELKSTKVAMARWKALEQSLELH